MALISTSATFAQVRTFTSNGQTFTVDIAATINSYYDEYNKPNGLWGCIPCILEYAAEKEHLSKAQFLYGISYMQGIDRDKDFKKYKVAKENLNSYLLGIKRYNTLRIILIRIL